jgi:hypothetical protein
METQKAKEIAQIRHDRMVRFLDEFMSEHNCHS